MVSRVESGLQMFSLSILSQELKIEERRLVDNGKEARD